MTSCPVVVPHSIRLSYFNATSRGELIRYILYYAKVPFTDHRINLSEWRAMKQNFPLGQVPILEYEDAAGRNRVMTQSSAIARTCARWFGLAGKTDAERSQADEVQECMRELLDAGSKLSWELDPTKKETQANLMKTEHIPRILKYLEKKLEENGGQFIAGGDSFTYADFAVTVVLDHLCKEILIIPNVAFRPALTNLSSLESEYPGLMALKKRVQETPSIKDYLAKRPDTLF